MRAVLVEVPEALLDERRRTGVDRFDEVWEGELHMNPPPGDAHQRLGLRLGAALLPHADCRDLVLSYETGVYAAPDESDYRVPDLVLSRADVRTRRGVEGAAELAVEIRSPGDETYAKLDFYAALGTRALLVVDSASRAVELYVLRGERLVVVQPDPDGWFTLEALGVALRERNGQVEIRDDAGARPI